MDRRQVIQTVGVAATTTIAGCTSLLGNRDENGSSTEMETATETATATATATERRRERRVVEDFEDGDMSEYSSENTPVGAGVEIVEGEDPLAEDESGLVITGDANTRHYSRADADGDTLDTYPKRGDVVEVRLYVRDGGRGAFIWAYDNSAEFYSFLLAADEGIAYLGKNDGGGETLDADDVPDAATGQWTRLVVEYDLQGDGTIAATLESEGGDEFVSLAATDDDLDEQGIAFTQGSGMDVGSVYESVAVRR